MPIRQLRVVFREKQSFSPPGAFFLSHTILTVINYFLNILYKRSHEPCKVRNVKIRKNKEKKVVESKLRSQNSVLTLDLFFLYEANCISKY